MNLPSKLLLSELLKHRVRCQQGLDHGKGVIPWMHPPVHRLLGWATKPSSLKLSRSVWSLNQCRRIINGEIFVKGEPVISDQATLERLPTLIDASLISIDDLKIGTIVDIYFDFYTGKIFNYLVSRTDPRLPGTSRWSLQIEKIIDQQPGVVCTNLKTLDELPLVRSSIREELIRHSRSLKDQLSDITDKASNKLEGWLEEKTWDQIRNEEYSRFNDFDGWIDSNDDYRSSSSDRIDNEEDPWV